MGRCRRHTANQTEPPHNAATNTISSQARYLEPTTCSILRPGGPMSAGQPGIDQLKERMRATWIAGDFGQIAKYSAKHAELFVERLGIQNYAKVLDVACGTGNTAIPAARAGAAVTGVDIAPNLLEQARQRAAAEDLTIQFDEGDAERLPYGDGEFDIVISMFGAMFAPRPELVAAELTRVCRSGGFIA